MAHSPVTLAEVSTLAQLYKDKTLKLPTKKSKFPYSKQFNNKISLWRGDITRLAVDAITNAANKNLTQGGGICGAIFKAAGVAKLREACAKIKTPLKPGDMRLTHGFDLPTGKVIHAVGPDCRIDEENEKRHDILSNLYFQLMLRSYMDGIKTVALCSISTGIYQYPLNEAVPIAVSWIRQFFETDPNQKKLDRVIFVVHDDETEEEYTRVIPDFFPPEGHGAPPEEKKKKEKAASTPAPKTASTTGRKKTASTAGPGEAASTTSRKKTASTAVPRETASTTGPRKTVPIVDSRKTASAPASKKTASTPSLKQTTLTSGPREFAPTSGRKKAAPTAASKKTASTSPALPPPAKGGKRKASEPADGAQAPKKTARRATTKAPTIDLMDLQGLSSEGAKVLKNPVIFRTPTGGGPPAAFKGRVPTGGRVPAVVTGTITTGGNARAPVAGGRIPTGGNPTTGQTGRKKPRCSNCGEEGHNKRNCPLNFG